MTDFASLAVRVDSREAKTAEKDLDRLGKASGTAEKETAKLSRTAKAAAAAIGAIGTSLVVRQLIQYTDQINSINNQLRQLTNTEQDVIRTRKQLIALSKETRSNLDSTTTLFARLTQSTTEMGLSQERLLKITASINKSFAIYGASAEEASGAIRQLAQGLAAGALRGDEFNSVAEQAPAIMDAIAAHLNMARGELREFAATGGITAQIVVDAMEAASDSIDERFGRTVATFAQRMENANTNMMEFVGSNQAVNGAVGIAGATVENLSENLDELLKVVEVAAALLVARYTPAVLGNTTAMASNAVATARAAGAHTAFSRGLALLGGPAGALTIAGVGALYLMDAYTSLDDKTKELVESIRAQNDALGELTRTQLQQAIEAGEQQIEQVETRLKKEQELADANVQFGIVDLKQTKTLKALTAEYEALNETLAEQKERLQSIKDEEFSKTLTTEAEVAEYYNTILEESKKRREEASGAIADNRQKAEDLIVNMKTELAQMQMTDRQRAISNALIQAGSDATGEQVVEIIRLTNALFDQEEALREAEDQARYTETGLGDLGDTSSDVAEAMIRDWQNVRQSFSEFFADLVLEGGNAFDALLKSWERTALQMAGSKLFDMGASMMGIPVPGGAGAASYGAFGSVLSSFGGKFAAGLTSPGAVITDAEFQQLMGGASTKTGFNMTDLTQLGKNIGAGIAGGFAGNELGEALFGKSAESSWGATAGGLAGSAFGPLGSFIGSAIGSMVDVAFGGDGKMRTNIGFLAGDTPGLKSEYDAGDYTFSSGLKVKLFERRAEPGSSREILQVFDQVERSYVDMVRELGGNISVPALRGLDEEANPGSYGNFFGIGGNGTTQGDILQQVNSFISQLGDHVSGLDDELLASIRSATTAEDALAILTKAVAENAAETEQAAAANESAADAIHAAATQFDTLAGSVTNYLQGIREEQERLLESQMRGVRTYYEDLHRRQFDLFRSLQSFTSSLRLGELSGLSGTEQLAFAKSEFDALASTALNTSLGTDQRLAAAEKLQGAAEDYLRQYRETNASAGYGGVFDSVMQTLEAAKFLGTNQPFEGSAVENAMLAELQKLNDQVGMLPPGIASQLAPIFQQIAISGLASGQSIQQVGTKIQGIIATTGVTGVSNPYAQHAYTKDDARAAVEGILANSGSMFDAVTRSAATLKDMGFSAALLQQFFPGTDIQGTLKQYGIPSFAQGTNFVPQDMLANIHRGERIVPAADNRQLAADNREIVAQLVKATEEIAEVKRAVLVAGGRAEEQRNRMMQKPGTNGRHAVAGGAQYANAS